MICAGPFQGADVSLQARPASSVSRPAFQVIRNAQECRGLPSRPGPRRPQDVLPFPFRHLIWARSGGSKSQVRASRTGPSRGGMGDRAARPITSGRVRTHIRSQTERTPVGGVLGVALLGPGRSFVSGLRSRATSAPVRSSWERCCHSLTWETLRTPSPAITRLGVLYVLC